MDGCSTEHVLAYDAKLNMPAVDESVQDTFLGNVNRFNSTLFQMAAGQEEFRSQVSLVPEQGSCPWS